MAELDQVPVSGRAFISRIIGDWLPGEFVHISDGPTVIGWKARFTRAGNRLTARARLIKPLHSSLGLFRRADDDKVNALIMQLFSPLTNLALFAALCGAVPAFADTPQLRGIGAAMQKMVEKNEIAGAVTVVVTRDKVIHLESTGFADIAAKRPMNADTLFWIASM